MIGLDFVCLACAPCVLAIISFAEFEVLKKQVKRCQEHLFGSPYNYLRTLSSRGGKGGPLGVQPFLPFIGCVTYTYMYMYSVSAQHGVKFVASKVPLMSTMYTMSYYNIHYPLICMGTKVQVSIQEVNVKGFVINMP